MQAAVSGLGHKNKRVCCPFDCAGRRKLGMVHKKATLGGLFQGGEASSEGDFQMMPHYGGVGLGGASNRRSLGAVMRGGSAWSAHVAAYRAAHPNVTYKEALKLASSDYTSVAKAKVNKSGKTRRSRGDSTHLYNVKGIRALRALTPKELEHLGHYIEQMLPKKFKGAGAHVMHHLNNMTGGGLFDMLGSILGL